MTIVVEVDPLARIRFEGRHMAYHELRDRLAERLSTERNARVVVCGAKLNPPRPDNDDQDDMAIEIMDLSYRLGARWIERQNLEHSGVPQVVHQGSAHAAHRDRAPMSMASSTGTFKASLSHEEATRMPSPGGTDAHHPHLRPSRESHACVAGGKPAPYRLHSRHILERRGGRQTRVSLEQGPA